MKKLLSLMIAVSMLFGMVIVPANAEEIQTSIQIMHNITEKYSENQFLEDANMLWLLPDMMTYQELFPDTENVISNEDKQAYADKIIDDVKDSLVTEQGFRGLVAWKLLVIGREKRV